MTQVVFFVCLSVQATGDPHIEFQWMTMMLIEVTNPQHIAPLLGTRSLIWPVYISSYVCLVSYNIAKLSTSCSFRYYNKDIMHMQGHLKLSLPSYRSQYNIFHLHYFWKRSLTTFWSLSLSFLCFMGMPKYLKGYWHVPHPKYVSTGQHSSFASPWQKIHSCGS